MREQPCLVVHRKSANRPEVKAAVKAVQRAHPELRVVVPWNKAEKPKVVAEALARGVTRIIAGGGDGTVGAIASAIVGRDRRTLPRVELGVLPLGTANDFARGCDLPVDDLEECLRIACVRPARRIDVGRCNKRTFINVASMGFGAEVTATTPVELKRGLGGAAYTLVGLVRSVGLTPYVVRLHVPGEPPVESDMVLLAVSNARYAGGGFDVGPLSRMDDGLLDLALIREPRTLDLLQLAAEIQDITNPDNEFVVYRQLSEFVIESDQKLHCNLDGEPLQRKKLRFTAIPDALDVVF